MTSTLLFRLLSPFAAAAVLLAPVAVAQAAAPAALKGNAEAGKAAFRKCASCHQVGPSARGGFGPKLTGVIGRKAGSTTGFLKAPSDFIPGNNMRFWGIGNAQQVADLLAYLRTQ